MNQKLTLQQLARALARATGSSQNLAGSFIKDFFALITDTLKKGESVTIKNFGKFSPAVDPEEMVVFTPDKELSQALNAPFSFFEPVELGDEVSDEALNEPVEIFPEGEPIEEETQAPDGEETAPEPLRPEETPAEEPVEEPGEEPVEEPSEPDGASKEEGEEEETPQEPTAGQESDEEYEEEYEEEEYEPAKTRSKGWLVFLVGLILGAIIGYFVAYFYPCDSWCPAGDKSDTASAGADSIRAIELPADTAGISQEQAAEQPSETYDTVTTRRFLSTMARKYYGHPDFWVYIYEENRQSLGDPNMIAPGTVLRIPPADKYGVDKNDPGSLEKARSKAAEIRRRYE